MTVKLDIVTAEKVVFSDNVDIVVAPGVEGELGALEHHAPLMTTLKPGELRARKAGEEYTLAVSGGFLEVRPDRVIVLADTAERAEEIDLERAEAARRRAQEAIATASSQIDQVRAEAALRRALTRIEVAERRKRKRQ